MPGANLSAYFVFIGQQMKAESASASRPSGAAMQNFFAAKSQTPARFLTDLCGFAFALGYVAINARKADSPPLSSVQSE